MLELIPCQYKDCEELMGHIFDGINVIISQGETISLCKIHLLEYKKSREKILEEVYSVSSKHGLPLADTNYDSEVEETDIKPLPNGLANAIGLTGCHCVSQRVSSIEETALSEVTPRKCGSPAGEPQWFQTKIIVKPFGVE